MAFYGVDKPVKQGVNFTLGGEKLFLWQWSGPEAKNFGEHGVILQ
jgi:hypothetical protein